MQLAPTWCAQGDSNPYSVKETEPKSVAYTNFATGACTAGQVFWTGFLFSERLQRISGILNYIL